MRYLSLCAGIEAATCAWHSLGWTAVAYSEIDPFASAVLAHHYPNVPNWGDMTKFQEWPDADVDVLVGGTPCQSFSVAGLRAGLADPRGSLMLVYLAIAARYRPEWLVWENVPGVLSSNGGRDFGSFLGGLAELGYGFAYRVLDAQYYGVAQRRRRVFVVANARDWRRAAAVLFDAASLRGDPAPRREAGEGVAPPIAGCSNGGGANGPGRTADDCDALIPHPHADISPAIKARDSKGASSDGDGDGDGAILVPMVAHSLRASGFDASEDGTGRGTPLVPVTHALDSFSAGRATEDGTGRGCPLVPVAFAQNQLGEVRCGDVTNTLNTNSNASGRNTPMVAFSCKDHGADVGEVSPTLRSMGHAGSHANAGGQVAAAFDARQSDVIQYGDKSGPLDTDGHTIGVAFGAYNQSVSNVSHPLRVGLGNGSGDEIPQTITNMQVRRLTPQECERLQGFPDDYTAIPYRGKPAADGPRYKALGNSMAVPVMAWIGRRIQMVGDVETLRRVA